MIIFKNVDSLANNMSLDQKNRHLFCSKEWLSFINKTQKAKILELAIYDDDSYVGFICGGIISKFGVKIFGSPFKGWSTPYMGFRFNEEKYYKEEIFLSVLSGLSQYLFKQYRVLYLEIVNREPIYYKKNNSKMIFQTEDSLLVDISLPQDVLFKKFKTDVRTNVRYFDKVGGTITTPTSKDKFVEEYYEQLIEVFNKQKLRPFYPKSRVDFLVECLNSNNILLLNAKSIDNQTISSSIFVYNEDEAYFWGNSSLSSSLKDYRPNEAIMWKAVQVFVDKGIKQFDLMGYRDYKMKYNPTLITYNRIMISKIPGLIGVRNIFKSLFYFFKRKKW